MSDVPGGRRLLDIHQAATYLGRNTAFIRRLVARREVPFFKIGGALRFVDQDLDRYVDFCRVDALPRRGERR
jgi:excisionase family DNA binding protein